MPEKTETVTEEQATETEAQISEAQPTETGGADEQIKRMEAALKKANSEAAKFRKQLEAFEKAEQERKDAELTETERLKKQLAEVQDRAKRLEHETLQRQAADKHGLPPEFANRLRGETPEELEADAEAIAKLLPKKPQTQPPVNPGDNASGKGETEAQQRNRVYRRGADIFDPVAISRQGGGVYWVDKNNTET